MRAMPAAQTRSDIRTYKGVGVSPGIAIGRAVIVEKRVASVYRVPIREDEVLQENPKFWELIEAAKAPVKPIAHRVAA